ncbi:otoancorin [Pygocentrus nattereri]|uniref:otoancorin n=1 Tax=Pygocentrus nattereri TaxID=42514 RepID=UPI001891494B|nr:otoancorin [Pygocentrus nattereri]
MTKLELVTDNQGLPNSPPAGCPRMPWLKAEALRMMGRFFSRLPEVEVKAIPTEDLCKFFVTPEFPSSFAKADGMQPAISQMLFQRLKQECSNSSQNFLNHIDRLGSLVCFFDDGPSLNATLSKKVLSQMADCENAGIDQIKRDLMRKVMSNGDVPPTIELLRTLGSSVSILPSSKLSDFSADTLKNGLTSLREVKWKPAQARILAQKLLEKNVTGESLLSLGSMVRGVDSEILRKVKLQGLLGNEGLKNMTEKMSSLQKKALLEGLRSSLNESDLVKKVPDSLLSSLSLLSLEKAGISSVDQLGGRSWSRTQSVYLIKKTLGQGIKSEQIRKLGQAVQGVTCSMIDSVNQSDTLTIVQTLADSSNWLSRTQVRCIANKLFLSLEKQRPGYFMNITNSELQAIPALLLIQLPIKVIQGLPATVCPRFLEKMSQANLSSLPNSAPSRWELRDRALRCLGKNASNLSTAEVLSLGPLVCELDPAWMSSLNPAALNSTLQALASCEHIPRPYRAPLFTLITRVYGAPSDWTEDVMKLLGPLLLLNDTSLETMPFKSWLKSSLSGLLDSLQPQTAVPRPEEFRSWPDLLALSRKLFQLKTNPILQRRRRAISPSVVPSVSAMEDLGEGNMYWSPAQLANMSVQTFREAMPVLGEIRNFTAEHLAVLREKAVEAWGDVSLLNQTQIVELGCICQGFNTKELQKLNITSLDTLELLSICNWNYTQKVAIWQGFIERTGIKMAQLGALEMTGLGNFICGLQPDQIDQLSTGEFKEAVEDIGHAKCPVTVLECLKRKAISAFGDPKSWGEAEASMMGNIMAGLNGTELASLNSSVLPFIRQSAITLILPERLAALSVNQLKSLGPDNAAMVTETQRSGLGAEQRAAVNESLGLPTSRSETSTSAPVAVPQKGGAPQQSVLGIAVLPVVLLLLGFLL